MRGIPSPLGATSVDEFMRRYWQRRPILVRQAFPRFVAPVPPQRLFELAALDDVESRLVTSFGGRWSMRRGPFPGGTLPSVHRRGWTVLVQGVDLHDDAAHALLARFRFVADARLDDLMISYATDGGGVGPHLDSYDVFLLQAQGRRRWRIGRPRSTALVPGVPLKLLARFEPEQEWVLEPGDLLYLPPQWAHEGTAVGECMTYSIGFRAPSRHEFLRAWLADAADDGPAGTDPRYRDPDSRPTATPGRIPEAMHARLGRWARDWRPDPRRVDAFIGRFITEPKPSVWFDARPRPWAPAAFRASASRRGLVADRRTRLAYRGARFFINGECFDAPAPARPALRRLADARALPPDLLGGTPVDAVLLDWLRQWSDAGWLHLGARTSAR